MSWLTVPLLLIALAAPADDALKDREIPAELGTRIHAAVSGGVRNLSMRQMPDGSWRIAKGRETVTSTGGLTALVGLALYHSGVSREDLRIARAREFVHCWMRDGTPVAKRRVPDTNTYSLGLALTFLLDTGIPPDDPVVRRMASLLGKGPGPTGHWDYFPIGDPRLRKWSVENVSTTLYAVYGLRAAHRHGVPFDKACLRRSMIALRRLQRDDGGWGYGLYRDKGVDFNLPYFSGTTNGLASYLMAGEILGRWSSPEKALEDQVVRDAVKWIANHFTPDRGPVGKLQSDPLASEPYYGLYAAERAGCLLDRRRFGRIDWYVRGARFITSRQERNGSWNPHPGILARYGRIYSSDVTTAFALLFLSRHTARVSTPPEDRTATRTARKLDALDLSRGPTLDRKQFAELVAAALAAYERLSGKERESRRIRFALLGPRVINLLVDGLESDRSIRREASIEILRQLVGEDFDFDPGAGPKARAATVRMWQHWAKTVGSRLVLREGRLVVGD